MWVEQDYFGALLFTRLMGPRVMNVSVANSDTVRAWGHCSGVGTATVNATSSTTPSDNRGSISNNDLTLLLLNLLNDTNTVDLSQAAWSGAAAVSSALRSDYILTPSSATKVVSEPSELLKTDVVNLNGRPLEMIGDEVPALEGEEVTGRSVATLKLPPFAVAFVVVSNAAVC